MQARVSTSRDQAESEISTLCSGTEWNVSRISDLYSVLESLTNRPHTELEILKNLHGLESSEVSEMRVVLARHILRGECYENRESPGYCWSRRQ